LQVATVLEEPVDAIEKPTYHLPEVVVKLS